MAGEDAVERWEPVPSGRVAAGGQPVGERSFAVEAVSPQAIHLLPARRVLLQPDLSSLPSLRLASNQLPGAESVLGLLRQPVLGAPFHDLVSIEPRHAGRSVHPAEVGLVYLS